MDRLDVFSAWLEKRGVRKPGVELKDCGPSCGSGLFASQSFRADESILEIPEDLLLTASKIAEMPAYRPLLESHAGLLSPFDALCLFFCLERSNSDSEWTPYLDALPTSFDTPIYRGVAYEPQELPESVRAYWLTQKKEFTECQSKIATVTSSSVSESRFLWAWHVVNTRCIFLDNKQPSELLDTSEGESLVVVPFVDMLNHHPNAQCLAIHEPKRGVYCVRAQRYVNEGSELFVCYGPHDNARLHIEYGFRLSPADNPYTRVTIGYDLFFALFEKATASAMEDERREIIKSASFPCSLYASDDGDVGWGLRTNLRLARMRLDKLRNYHRELDEEPSEKEDDDIDQTLRRLLGHLVAALTSKTRSQRDAVRWMWDEQLAIVERTKLKLDEELSQS